MHSDFMQSANALPSEHIIFFSFEDCYDTWFEDTTCGKYLDYQNKEVWDSQVDSNNYSIQCTVTVMILQGFCCRCERTKGILPRANNASCEGNFFDIDRATVIGDDDQRYEFRASAHCMNVSDLWYSNNHHHDH